MTDGGAPDTTPYCTLVMPDPRTNPRGRIRAGDLPLGDAVLHRTYTIAGPIGGTFWVPKAEAGEVWAIHEWGLPLVSMRSDFVHVILWPTPSSMAPTLARLRTQHALLRRAPLAPHPRPVRPAAFPACEARPLPAVCVPDGGGVCVHRVRGGAAAGPPAARLMPSVGGRMWRSAAEAPSVRRQGRCLPSPFAVPRIASHAAIP